MITAIYPGSFDPMTRGHEDLIRRALGFVDRLVVAVAQNSSKQPMFTLEERVSLMREAIGNEPRIQVKSFTGLLVDFAKSEGANLLIRGLRAVSDFEYEYQMALMNRRLAPEIETVFLMASDKWQFVSSSFLKEIARLGGDIAAFVTPRVQEKILEAVR